MYSSLWNGLLERSYLDNLVHPGAAMAALGRRGPRTVSPLPGVAASGNAIAISSTTPPRRGDKLTFNWSTDAADPTNWIGVYKSDRKPSSGVGSLVWAYVPGASGNTTLDTSGLSDGPYTAYLLAKDGYEILAQTDPFTFTGEPLVDSLVLKAAGHPVRG